METSFDRALLTEVLKQRRNNYRDNEDPTNSRSDKNRSDTMSFRSLRGEVGEVYRKLRAFVGSIYRLTRATARILRMKLSPRAHYVAALKSFSEIGFLYDNLRDASSKDLLLKLFAFRVLGHKKVKLPRNTPEYWAGIDRVQALKTDAPNLPVKSMNLEIGKYDLREIGFPSLSCYGGAGGLACIFVQKQYEYHNQNVNILASPGDIVVDGGGCWGDTALYFAQMVGEGGKVYCFEFIPENLKVLRRNLQENPRLEKRIEIVDAPMWSMSGKKLYYVDWGPGSNVSSEKLSDNYVETQTESIDDLVRERNIPRVDFIKMDIEGAELDSLKGAEDTIKRHRPKLAISLYHQLSDFHTIPKYLESLNLDYDFYLDHHTIYENETVLFAVSRSRTTQKQSPEAGHRQNMSI